MLDPRALSTLVYLQQRVFCLCVGLQGIDLYTAAGHHDAAVAENAHVWMSLYGDHDKGGLVSAVQMVR